jgi:hypothetical protein
VIQVHCSRFQQGSVVHCGHLRDRLAHQGFQICDSMVQDKSKIAFFSVTSSCFS